jgi:hypothetical protein
VQLPYDETSEELVHGTWIQFPDEPWSFEEVEKHAVFSRLKVLVDDQECSREPFVSMTAVSYNRVRMLMSVARGFASPRTFSSYCFRLSENAVIIGCWIPF